jgi:Holliday junction resolvase
LLYSPNILHTERRAVSRGHTRERQVRKLLEDDGWFVCRAAGSLGDADLVALRDNQGDCRAWLIEVKSTARGPYHGFGPSRRFGLKVAAGIAGAQAWLCWWPPRKEPKWIHEGEWPA